MCRERAEGKDAEINFMLSWRLYAAKAFTVGGKQNLEIQDPPSACLWVSYVCNLGGGEGENIRESLAYTSQLDSTGCKTPMVM